MSLEHVRDELNAITEGLYYGEIEFTYDAMGFTEAFSHPAEILGDMAGELDVMLENDAADPAELELMLSGLKEIVWCFDLVELKDAIGALEEYIKDNK